MAYDPAATVLQVKSHLSTLATDPLRNFKFVVQINHDVQAPVANGGQVSRIGFTLGFTSVDGFQATVAPIPYRAGNLNTAPQMIPGQTSYPPISFSRGLLLGTRQNYDWFRQIFSVSVGEGDFQPNGAGAGAMGFRAHVDVWLLPHPRTDTSTFNPVAHWRLYNAWPTTLSYSGLNAADNAFVVEQMVLAHEGWAFSPYRRFATDPTLT